MCPIGTPAQLAANKRTERTVGRDVAVSKFPHMGFKAAYRLFCRNVFEHESRDLKARREVVKGVEFIASARRQGPEHADG